ncbi:MAG TPA: glycosyltransferase family 4 protein [Thermoanaerobaculia bacterium]|nr:glycosyltransferase family 4 protein [Thermoanaerobaculia bacterium]
MSRILVATAQVPFASGGAERHARGLVRELGAAGHEVDLVQLPFQWYPREEIVTSALSWRLLDLSEADGRRVDLVIPMKFPSYLVRHENKVVWLIHQFRQAYDRFGTADSDFDAGARDTRWRELIRSADAAGLGEARKVFTNSRNTADRLERFNGIGGEPLYHPPPLALRHRCGEMGRFALAAGRLDRWKRVDLAIEAAAKGGFRLAVAGAGPDRERLERVARETRADVDFRGAVSDEELLDLYASCGAVVFTPADEDYGYVALEAFLSGKPVMTCTDSGGPLEFVTDGENGRVVTPDAGAIGEATRALLDAPDLARAMGERGRERAARITWGSAVEALLSAGGID